MHEHELKKLSLLLSGAGLLAMYSISTDMEFDRTMLGDISSHDVGRVVKVCGSVEGKFTSKTGHLFFTLVDIGGSLRIVAFNSSGIQNFRWKEACVVGEVDSYKGQLELIADEVRPYD